jgi:hypothetical protein
MSISDTALLLGAGAIALLRGRLAMDGAGNDPKMGMSAPLSERYFADVEHVGHMGPARDRAPACPVPARACGYKRAGMPLRMHGSMSPEPPLMRLGLGIPSCRHLHVGNIAHRWYSG